MASLGMHWSGHPLANLDAPKNESSATASGSSQSKFLVWPSQRRNRESSSFLSDKHSKELLAILQGCMRKIQKVMQSIHTSNVLKQEKEDDEPQLHEKVRRVSVILQESLAPVVAPDITEKGTARQLQLLLHAELTWDLKPMKRWFGGVPGDLLALSYVYHMGLSPLERLLRSGPRAVAFADLLLRQQFNGCYPEPVIAGRRPLVIWIIGVTSSGEGELARRGYFEDVADLAGSHQGKTEAPFADIYMIGSIGPGLSRIGNRVRLHAWGPVELCGLPEEHADLVVGFHTQLGGLLPASVEPWLPLLSSVLCPVDARHPPVLLLTSRCETEAYGEESLLRKLGVDVVLAPTRNLFSGAAADPYAQCDDHGWLVMARAVKPGLEKMEDMDPNKLCEDAKEMVSRKFQSSPGADIYGKVPLPKNARSTAIFWGILDLKYDPDMPVGQRVKVLEMGDGRSSRFSGYGARIREAFKSDHKVEDVLHHGVLFENKKLTHDCIFDKGYDHILPKQLVFRRVYTKDLAAQIIHGLSLQVDDGVCVLKLCNKARGAGCIPIRASELDETLRHLLDPPPGAKDKAKLKHWMHSRQSKFVVNAYPGCFDEQLRHWWSNECPCFIVEELCLSKTTRRRGQDLDGTMRVGFLLHRLEKNQSVGAQAPPSWASQTIDDNNLDMTTLRTIWLGGYWKLPEADIHSADLRGRIISKAKQGTALVKDVDLHEVYAAVGDAMAQLFSLAGQEISPYHMSIKYDSFPEFAAFVVARLSCSMKTDVKNAKMIEFAHLLNSKGQKGCPQTVVRSYIHRIAGISEALQGNWSEAEVIHDDARATQALSQAERCFQKSLESMPSNSTTWYLCGMRQLEAKQYHAAIQDMEASLELDPDFKAPCINIGVAWLELKAWQDVVEVSEAGINRHPQNPHCLYHLGIGCYMLASEAEGSRNKPAIELRKRALEALTAARDHIKRNRREGVQRGAQPVAVNGPDRASATASQLASNQSRGEESPNSPKSPPASPKKKSKSLWTQADDKLVEQLQHRQTKLIAPTTLMGWKFYGWRP